MRLAYKLARLRAPLAPKLCAASGLYQIFRHLVLPRSSRVCRGFAMRCGVGYREYKRNERFDATSSSLSTLSFPPTFYLPSGEPVLLSYGLVLFQLAPVAGSPCFHFDFSLSLSPPWCNLCFPCVRALSRGDFAKVSERAIRDKRGKSHFKEYALLYKTNEHGIRTGNAKERGLLLYDFPLRFTAKFTPIEIWYQIAKNRKTLMLLSSIRKIMLLKTLFLLIEVEKTKWFSICIAKSINIINE